eukprot:scaffold536_cov98-Isochrysis_galbana.AAC.1
MRWCATMLGRERNGAEPVTLIHAHAAVGGCEHSGPEAGLWRSDARGARIVRAAHGAAGGSGRDGSDVVATVTVREAATRAAPPPPARSQHQHPLSVSLTPICTLHRCTARASTATT